MWMWYVAFLGRQLLCVLASWLECTINASAVAWHSVNKYYLYCPLQIIAACGMMVQWIVSG